MKNNIKIRYDYIIFLIGIAIMISLSSLMLNNSFKEKLNTQREEKGKFDPNPNRNKLGFFTINDDNCVTSRGCENIKNRIRLKKLLPSESTVIKLFIDYKNGSDIDLEYVRAKVYFGDYNSKEMPITASLSSINANTIYDMVFLENLPEEYKISYSTSYLLNDSGLSGGQLCAGYSYHILPNDFPSSKNGILIGGIPSTIINNQCSRGILRLEYLITNTKSI